MSSLSSSPAYYRCKTALESKVNYILPPQSLAKFIVIKTSQACGAAAIGYLALRYISAPIAHKFLENVENNHRHSLIVESLLGTPMIAFGVALPVTIIFMRAHDRYLEWKKKHPLLGLEEPKHRLSFLSPRDSFPKHLALESVKVTVCVLSTLAIFSLIAHFTTLHNGSHQEMHKTLTHRAITEDVIGGSLCIMLVMGLIGVFYQPCKDLIAHYETWKDSEAKVLASAQAQRDSIAARKE